MRPSLSSIDHMVSCVRIVPAKIPDQGIFGSDPLSPKMEYRLAAFPRDLQMTNGDLNWYSSLSINADTALKISSGLAPGTVEIESPYGIDGISRLLLEMDYFRGAKCYIFNTCWVDPVEDEQPSGLFIWGKTSLLENSFKVELTHISDLLKQDTHMHYSKLCSNFFCDVGNDWQPRYHIIGSCGLDPTPYTKTGTIKTITSNIILADSSRTEPDGYFDNGLISFRNDTGMHGVDQCSYEIVSYVNKVFTLAEPVRCYGLLVANSTEYVALKGCKKRREDCVANNNGARFMGFHDIPVKSDVFKLGGFK